jgi:hypothetical protein
MNKEKKLTIGKKWNKNAKKKKLHGETFASLYFLPLHSLPQELNMEPNAPLAGAGQLKPSAQEPCGDDKCQSSIVTQQAICWGELWVSVSRSEAILCCGLEQKPSEEPLQTSLEGMNPTLEPKQLPLLLAIIPLKLLWLPAEDLWIAGIQQGKLTGTQKQLTEVMRMCHSMGALPAGSCNSNPDRGWTTAGYNPALGTNSL